MKLQYEDLIIRLAVKSDAQTLCNWWNDGAIMEHAGFPHGLGQTDEQIENQISKTSVESFLIMILVLNDKAIGEMNYRNVGDNTASIGIKICDASKRERGLGTKYLKMLIAHLFNSGYEKILVDCSAVNQRAQHVYKKIGFKELRLNVDSWINQIGEPMSFYDYELLREDFEPLR